MSTSKPDHTSILNRWRAIDSPGRLALSMCGSIDDLCEDLREIAFLCDALSLGEEGMTNAVGDHHEVDPVHALSKATGAYVMQTVRTMGRLATEGRALQKDLHEGGCDA